MADYPAKSSQSLFEEKAMTLTEIELNAKDVALVTFACDIK